MKACNTYKLKDIMSKIQNNRNIRLWHPYILGATLSYVGSPGVPQLTHFSLHCHSCKAQALPVRAVFLQDYQCILRKQSGLNKLNIFLLMATISNDT